MMKMIPKNWQAIMRTSMLFVPESKKIDELLREFQKKGCTLAIIVDEFGGTVGIATLEDIMEEVVGWYQRWVWWCGRKILNS